MIRVEASGSVQDRRPHCRAGRHHCGLERNRANYFGADALGGIRPDIPKPSNRPDSRAVSFSTAVKRVFSRQCEATISPANVTPVPMTVPIMSMGANATMG